MDDRLIKAIKDHVLFNQHWSIPFPPATLREIEETEASLGFEIPEALKLLYACVGNGGFGPRGGRIIGLTVAACDDGTLLQAYQAHKDSARYWWNTEWPDSMLPFCDWGCKVYSCVDCKVANLHIHVARDAHPWPQPYNLDDFMRMWLVDVEMLDLDPRPVVKREQRRRSSPPRKAHGRRDPPLITRWVERCPSRSPRRASGSTVRHAGCLRIGAHNPRPS